MAQQSYPNDPRGGSSRTGPQVRYGQNGSAAGLTQAQRQARARRRQELLRRRQRRFRGTVIGILLLLVIIGGLLAIWNFRGSNGATEEQLDVLDSGELDDEAEEALYNGPPEATIAFVGDISVSEDQVRAVTKADGNLDFSEAFADVAGYFTTDRIAYAVGDFETNLVSGQNYGGAPYYNAPIELAGALRSLGFRLVSTANTYALNNGIEGVISTKNYLTSAKLRSVGTYLSQEERDLNGGAYIRNIHKIKFAFLAYTKGTDSVTMPEGCEYALNTLYTDYADYWSELRSTQIRRDIQAVKDAGAEVIVVLLHWGSEYGRSVTEPQKELTDLLLSNGVDVIIGTHSHLVNEMGFQKAELADGTTKQCFVAYGLGDFYTDPEQPSAQESLILNLTFSRGDNGVVTITDANYIPIYNSISQADGTRRFHVLEVYRNLAELKRVDMNSEQAQLFNALLSTINTVHTYCGEEMDVGPADKDRRIVEKSITEGPYSDEEIRALQRAEKQEADAARRAAQEARETENQEGEAGSSVPEEIWEEEAYDSTEDWEEGSYDPEAPQE